LNISHKNSHNKKNTEMCIRYWCVASTLQCPIKIKIFFWYWNVFFLLGIKTSRWNVTKMVYDKNMWILFIFEHKNSSSLYYFGAYCNLFMISSVCISEFIKWNTLRYKNTYNSLIRPTTAKTTCKIFGKLKIVCWADEDFIIITFLWHE